jgi:hypothetical protein
MRFVEDVLLHESVHQYCDEVLHTSEKSYKGHGPVFANECTRIGELLGLPPVRPAKARGPNKDMPSCADWPHNVRPREYYLGALAELEPKTADEDDAGDDDELLTFPCPLDASQAVPVLAAHFDRAGIETILAGLTETEPEPEPEREIYEAAHNEALNPEDREIAILACLKHATLTQKEQAALILRLAAIYKRRLPASEDEPEPEPESKPEPRRDRKPKAAVSRNRDEARPKPEPKAKAKPESRPKPKAAVSGSRDMRAGFKAGDRVRYVGKGATRPPGTVEGVPNGGQHFVRWDDGKVRWMDPKQIARA